MENVPYQGQTLTRWRVGNSTFLALPEKGARLMSWTITLGDGSVREVLYWPENANISPPHSPTPVRVLSVFGAAGAEAISCSKPPADIQGQSLMPILKDPGAVGRGWAVSQVLRGGGIKRFGAAPAIGDNVKRFFGYTLRTSRWRYTEWDNGRQGRELYDHSENGAPKELTNLADKPGHAATVAELSAKLSEAVKTTFPADGKTPELRDGTWAPNLTNP